MIFWLMVAVLTAGAVAAVLYPVLRRRELAVDAASYDLEVYRDQIAEVDRELEEGLLTPEQSEAAKAEIGRRILSADARRSRSEAPGGAASAATESRMALRVGAAVVALVVPGGALALYLWVGSPDLPDQPLAARDVPPSEHAAITSVEQAAPDLEASADRLAQRLAEDPDSLEGWVLLARTYTTLRRYRAAEEAYQRAIELSPNDPTLRSAYGETLTIAADGVVTPKARAAFQEALAIAPQDPRSRYYLALGAYQEGDARAALDAWSGLITDSPADAPWLEVVRTRVREARARLGLDVDAELPQPGPPAGPSEAEVAAVEQMPPAERQEMIRSMVAQLATRLEQDPKDFEGWQRLIRGYAALGETETASAALAKALEVFGRAPFVRQQLTALGAELGLQTAAAPGPRGPSQEDVQAVMEMTPEDRQAMIEGMVQQLAERLEQEPDDLEGWLMLARSYNTLGRPEGERDALGRAAELAPDNVEILTMYARAVREIEGADTAASIAVLRRVLERDPNNLQALWFVALWEARAGRKAEARVLFDRALEQLPPDSPQRAELSQRAKSLLGEE